MTGLSAPVISLSGIGPVAAEKLDRLGIEQVRDLVFFVPRDYQDRRFATPIEELQPGQEAVVEGQVASSRVRRGRRGRILELTVEDGTGRLQALWFRAPVYLAKKFPTGTEVRMVGRWEPDKKVPTFYHPDTAVEGEGRGAGILPVYGATEGVGQRQLARWVGVALEAALGLVEDRVPANIRQQLGLMDLTAALELLHNPPDDADLVALQEGDSEAHQTLLFQHLFGIQLALAMRRSSVKATPGVQVDGTTEIIRQAEGRLPFQLTGAQQRAIREIHEDMLSGRPVCRLLQGDVGSGKTIVAMLAALPVLASGHQVAIMVPTEVLADQHLASAETLFGPLGYRITFLGGSLRARPRRDALEQIVTGTAQVVIGTQALFQQGVEFAALGLAVVDEQHRFGVQQRADLAGKGTCPHVLAMTATPIPRSMAMAMYGDLDLTVIDELPPRGEIMTRLVTDLDRSRVYATVRAAVERGERAFIVFPLVEASENLERVQDAVSMSTVLAEGPLKGIDVGLLHGRMDSMDKEQVVADFRAGRIQVLATTTVVEVGIDVPEASVMVVENAERFGLAQLHQLRGRIGRSEREGRCLLFAGEGSGRERLEILASTRDGFEIAEADLHFRGPGDLMGRLQAGRPGMRMPSSGRLSQTLADAQREAQALAARPDFETNPEYEGLRTLVRERWGDSFRLGV